MWLTRPVVSTRGMTRVYPNDAGRYTMNAEPQPANLGKIEHLECKKRTQGILQQALQQQLALYNQPLNQIAALMSGSQIQMPQFQGYQGANVAAAPIFQAGQAQAQDAMARYNADVAGSNALMGGLFGLGGAALQGAGAAKGFANLFSDRRLKIGRAHV